MVIINPVCDSCQQPYTDCHGKLRCRVSALKIGPHTHVGCKRHIPGKPITIGLTYCCKRNDEVLV